MMEILDKMKDNRDAIGLLVRRLIYFIITTCFLRIKKRKMLHEYHDSKYIRRKRREEKREKMFAP